MITYHKITRINSQLYVNSFGYELIYFQQCVRNEHLFIVCITSYYVLCRIQESVEVCPQEINYYEEKTSHYQSFN